MPNYNTNMRSPYVIFIKIFPKTTFFFCNRLQYYSTMKVFDLLIVSAYICSSIQHVTRYN